MGQQPDVPAPEQNQQMVVYSSVDYKTGQLGYTPAKTKSGTTILAFLVGLVGRYPGRKIPLVCDSHRFQTI
jgi:hypothetical protein